MIDAANSLKILLSAAILAAGLAVPAQAQKAGAKGNEGEPVRVTVSASGDTLGRGSGGELLVKFSPRKGYHVNAVPPMAVKFDSASPALGRGEIVIPTDTATGYLMASLPVRRPFTLSPAAARGRAEIRGVLTYYYCSDAEGWCRKENLPFALKVTVR